MKRALVTGATGFVGANVARRLLQDGHQVSILVRPDANLWRLADVKKELRIHEVHLETFEPLNAAVKQINPEWIFHLAVHGAYSWQTDWQSMVQTNVLGTMNLVEACLNSGFDAFVNTGSSSEYGFKDHSPVESESIEPNSYYAVTKASATMSCRYIAQNKKVHLPTLRLYSVYGPYEEPKRLMPTLIAKGLSGQLPPLVDPSIARDYIYIDDVVDAYLLAANNKTPELGAIYNIGTGKQTSLQELVSLIQNKLQITDEPKWGSMENRIWDSTTWVADNRKFCQVFNWQPKFDLDRGLNNFIDWVKTNPAMQEIYLREYKYAVN